MSKRSYTTNNLVKDNHFTVYFDLRITTLDRFYNNIISLLKLNADYLVLVTIQHENGYYHTCGPSISLSYTQLDSIHSLHHDIIACLNVLLDEYNIDSYSVEHIGVRFKELTAAFKQDF